MNKGKISILMGLYNCEDTLSESINSIIVQTYSNWELIMCDDCSTDNTYNVAKEYANKYPNKIKLIRNTKNLTLGPTLNKCLEIATGEYIARHDGDDLYKNNKLEKQIKFLHSNKNIDLVGTGMKIFDENGYYGKRVLKESPEGKDLVRGTTFAHATIMARVNVYNELNGYSEEKNRKGVEDYDLWFRFFARGFKGKNINECLYEVREDRAAYKRKNIRRRINEVDTMISGIKLLKLDKKQYLFVFKPILATIIPKKLLMKYHKRKVNN